MHRSKMKIKLLVLPLCCLTTLVSSNERKATEISAWETTVKEFTTFAKDLGLDQANEPCTEFLKDDSTCMKKWSSKRLWREVEANKITILECNKFEEVSTKIPTSMGICQLKSWFIILMIFLICMVWFCVLGCLFCLVWGCCCRRK